MARKFLYVVAVLIMLAVATAFAYALTGRGTAGVTSTTEGLPVAPVWL